MGAGGMVRGGFGEPELYLPEPPANINVQAVPTMDSIVLTGLDFSMRPDLVRYEVEKGFIKPLSEIKAKHLIKSLAIMVYNQMKYTPIYHGRVCSNRSALAFFLCAVHRLQAPQPKSSHSRQNSNSSLTVSDGDMTITCQYTDGKKNCELPKLTTSSMLPFGDWDSLYYALVAEIHQLHSDLQERFGFGCENGTQAIHYRGIDGSTNEAMTAIDLASLLETAWYELMDNRLVATLDNAVRLKNFLKLQATGELDFSDRPPVLYGLIDVNSLNPDDILHLLWEKYRAEVDAACLENFEDESMLSEYRAQQYRELLDQSMANQAPLSANRLCKCHRACVCKLKCDGTTDICTCNHEHVYRLNDQPDQTGDIMIKYVKEPTTKPDVFASFASNTLEDTHGPVLGSTSDVAASSSGIMSNASSSGDSNQAIKNRKRANTNNSELAYVPSGRASKDAYPLDFYGRKSGDRYPTIASQSTASSSRRPSADQSSMPFNKGKMLARKPVATTPTSPGPLANFTYPTVPVSQSQNMFTQSFPAPGADNPCDTEKEDNSNKKSNGRAITNTMQYGATDYTGLLSKHPSSNEDSNSDIEPFPKLIRAVTTSPPRKAKSGRVANDVPPLNYSKTIVGAVPTLNAINKPTPPLPEPKFIAPKPAVKQRYVSAGGNIPLSERPEIEGPALHTPSPAAGRAITKEELDAKMSDPEWVRRNFGEDAVIAYCTPPRMSSVDEPRDSKYNSKNASKRNSGRKSDESDRETPRDRTSSSASKRGKLMRLFSRQGSINEAN